MKIFNTIAITLIVGYRRVVSPLFPASCRFAPSCSQYALEAFKRFGFLRAFRLTAIRILKCHPYHPGGYDPLPPQ